MPEITYISPDESRTVVDVPVGTSVMRAAVDAGVPGIVAECGGSLMCATCHVYVDEAWTDRAGGPGEEEDEMLEETLSPRDGRSRLSCQLVVSPELDGLVVHTPAEQA